MILLVLIMLLAAWIFLKVAPIVVIISLGSVAIIAIVKEIGKIINKKDSK